MNNIIPIKKGSHIPDIEIKGRTLVNLFGKSGNPIYNKLDDFEVVNNQNVGLEIDVDKFIMRQTAFDSKAFRCKHTISDAGYYICLADVKFISGPPTTIAISQYVDRSQDTERRAAQCKDKKDDYTTIFTLIDKKSTTPAKLGIGMYEIENVENSGVEVVVHAKNMRLYRLNEQDFQFCNDRSVSVQEIAERFHYVDDAKCVVNPYIESNENLLYGYNTWKHGIVDPDGNVSVADYVSGERLTGNVVCVDHKLQSKQGEEYTLNMEGIDPNVYQLVIWNFKSGQPTVLSERGNHSVTIKCDKEGIIKVAVRAFNGTTDKVPMEFLEELLNSGKCKLTLTKGTEPKSYGDCHSSRIVFETKLYDGETISRTNDGTYVKNKIFHEYLLTPDNIDFSEVEIFDSTTLSDITPGYKSILLHGADCSPGMNTSYVVRYDGKILQKHSGENYRTVEGFHLSNRGDRGHKLYLLISNEITGWTDGVFPTIEEVKAFFLGWKKGTDNTWAKLWCGVGEKVTSWGHAGAPVVSGSGVSKCPDTMNDMGFKPYRVIFMKPQCVEEVNTHGSLTLTDNAQIKTGSGLVLNEKVKMCGFRPDERLQVGGISKLDNRNGDILEIRKSGEQLQFLNIKFSDSKFMNLYGQGNAITNTTMVADYDYTCDYLMYYPDTVSVFDYNFKTVKNTRDLLDNMYEELSNCYRDLSETKYKLEINEHQLSEKNNSNLLINGDFQVWQRGTSFTNLEGFKYTADRWQVYRGNGATSTMNAVKTEKGIKVYSSQLATGMLYLAQTIECPASLWGRNITLSYKGDQTYANINFNKTVVSGSSGASLGSALTKSNDKIKHLTTTVPVGTKSLSVLLFIDTALKTSFEIEWVKLEVGEYPTQFSPRTYAEELSMCQRYFVPLKWSQYQWGHGYGHLFADGNGWFFLPLQQQMRATPTLIANAAKPEFWTMICQSGRVSLSSISVRAVCVNGVLFNIAIASTISQIQTITGYFNNGELSGLDAEIY